MSRRRRHPVVTVLAFLLFASLIVIGIVYIVLGLGYPK
jgi:hypothetical protein